MTYTIRQLAGLDPVDVVDGDPVFIDDEHARGPRTPPGAALPYGTRWPRARAAAEINAALDRLIADLELLGAPADDPF
jgi:hypothetical protein